MNARSCPTCQSIGPRRMLGDDVAGPLPCGDVWHDPSPDTGGAMVSTASLPTHPEPEPAGPTLAFEVRFKPGADADDSFAVLKAVLSELDGQVADVVTVTDVGRLHEDLRQANLRHRTAERDVADLKAEVGRLCAVEFVHQGCEGLRAKDNAHLIGRRDAAEQRAEQLRGLLQLACNVAMESCQQDAIEAARVLLREADEL